MISPDHFAVPLRSGSRQRAHRGSWRRSSSSRRGGSATLELAVVLPILVSIMLICCDFGRYVHYHIAVTNAARAGAEYGITHPVTAATLTTWQANVTAAARKELSDNVWYAADRVTLTPPTSTPEGALGMRTVSVTVTYEFRTVIPWPFLANYDSPKMLTRTIVMRGIR